jgi:hypothetical protein
MGRGSDSRESDHLRLLGLSARAAAHHQWFGAHKPGTQTPHPRSEHLLQSRVVPARLVSACPTRRRVRPTRSISTSTRNSGVMTPATKNLQKRGCTIGCPNRYLHQSVKIVTASQSTSSRTSRLVFHNLIHPPPLSADASSWIKYAQAIGKTVHTTTPPCRDRSDSNLGG